MSTVLEKTIEAALYAEAGVPEHWLLDLNTRYLEAARPDADAGRSVWIWIPANDPLPGERIRFTAGGSSRERSIATRRSRNE